MNRKEVKKMKPKTNEEAIAMIAMACTHFGWVITPYLDRIGGVRGMLIGESFKVDQVIESLPENMVSNFSETFVRD